MKKEKSNRKGVNLILGNPFLCLFFYHPQNPQNSKSALLVFSEKPKSGPTK